MTKREREAEFFAKKSQWTVQNPAFFPGQDFSPAIKRHFPNKKEEKRGFLFFLLLLIKKPPRINRLTPFPPSFFPEVKTDTFGFCYFYYFSVRENELKSRIVTVRTEKREISFQPTFSPFFSRVNQLRLGYAHD